MASGLRRCASSSVICVESFSTVSTTASTRDKPRLAGLRIDLAADVVFRAVARFRGLLDRVLHRLDDDLAVDRLLARDRVGDLQKLEPIGTDAGHCHGSTSSSHDPRSLQASRPDPTSLLFFARRKASRIRSSVKHELRLADRGPTGRPITCRARFGARSSSMRISPSSKPSSVAAKALAAVDRLRQLDLGLVARPSPRNRTGAPAGGRCPARRPRADRRLQSGHPRRAKPRFPARSPRNPRSSCCRRAVRPSPAASCPRGRKPRTRTRRKPRPCERGLDQRRDPWPPGPPRE